MAKDNSIYITDMASQGVNTRDDPREIASNQSPYIENMDIVQKGRVLCRTGYEEWGDTGSTGGMRGLLRYKKPYGTNSGDYMLSFGSDGKVYSSTASSPTPSDLGSYGSGTDNPMRGIVYDNIAIFGNGESGNAVKKWDASTLADLGGSPPNANVFGTINNCLAVVDPVTPGLLYWSDVGDPENWSGGIASNTSVGPADTGQKVTVITEANDQATVFKEESKFPAEVIFDNVDILARIAFKEKVDSSGGCIAPGSVKSIPNSLGEMIHYLSKKGFQGYGAIENFSGQRNPAELSSDINSAVKTVNFNSADVINSEFTDDRYICIVPFGSATQNTNAFIRHIDFGAWTIYSGMNFADISNFTDTDGSDIIIAASNAEPKLFKFNNEFNDDGFGYNREYLSKIWTYSQPVRWDWIDFEGVKTVGSTIYINIVIDDKVKRFKVTDKNLTKGIGGGYLGSNWTGKAYTGGGAFGTSTPLLPWRGRAKLGIEGIEIQFSMFNSNADEGWGAKSYRIMPQSLNNDVAKNPRTQNLAYLELA